MSMAEPLFEFVDRPAPWVPAASGWRAVCGVCGVRSRVCRSASAKVVAACSAIGIDPPVADPMVLYLGDWSSVTSAGESWMVCPVCTYLPH